MAAVNEQDRNVMWETAKGVGQAYLNPLNWLKYNPGIYQPLRGRMRLPFGPFGGGGVQSLVRKFVGKDIPYLGNDAYIGYGKPGGGFGYYSMGTMAKDISSQTMGLATPVGPAVSHVTEANSVRLAAFLRKNKPGVTVGEPIGSNINIGIQRAARSRPQILLGTNTPVAVGQMSTVEMNTGIQSAIKSRRFIRTPLLTHNTSAGELQLSTASRKIATRFAGKATTVRNVGGVYMTTSDIPRMLASNIRSTGNSVGNRLHSAIAGGKSLTSRGLNLAGQGLKTALPRVAIGGVLFVAKAWSIWEVTKLAGAAFAFGAESLGNQSISLIDQSMKTISANREWEMGANLTMAYLSRGAATERQRAVQAISKSRLNARAGLGMEASGMHM